jgi:signal transduction histidine kinase
VYEFVTEDDQRRSAENLPHLTEAGVIAPTEYTAVRQDGTTVPVEISAAISRDAQGFPVAFMAVIRDITERKRAEDALRQSRDKLQKEHRTLKHLLQSSDHERQLIAYEIHDGLAQQLAGAIMQFQTFQHLKETKPKDAAKAFDAGVTMLQQGHFEARRLISGVRPPILDEEGVVAAVAHLVNEQRRLKGPKIEYRNNVDFDRLAPILENGIYRIAQEGLANACQHSGSERVRVTLLQREDRIRIEVRDWGVGFDVGSIQENRFGLVGIRQRARLLGGKCSIRSTPGKGARVSVELPVVARD